jgi:hypothetical protein
VGLAESFRALLPGVRPGELAAALPALEPGVAQQIGIASPWASPNHLASVVWSDIFGADVPTPVTRAEAMSVPAVARARGILAAVIGNIPLRAYRGRMVLGEPGTPPAPSWIAGTHQTLSPYHRMVWTVDDLLFFGASCWSRVNGADGYPTQMDRIPMGRWSVDAESRICVDRLDGQGHQPVPGNEVCFIPGPHEGILTFAQDTIRHAKDLEKSAQRAADNPTPHTEIRQVAGDPIPEDQVDQIVARYHARRKMTDGAVSWLNQALESKSVGSYDAHLMIGGRNAAAVDIARAVGLPADLLDAAGEHSLTYANVRDNDKRAISYGAGLYTSAISAALSQDGVTPRGQAVRFDIESWLGAVPTAEGSAAPAGTTTAPPSSTPEDAG